MKLNLPYEGELDYEEANRRYEIRKKLLLEKEVGAYLDFEAERTYIITRNEYLIFDTLGKAVDYIDAHPELIFDDCDQKIIKICHNIREKD